MFPFIFDCHHTHKSCLIKCTINDQAVYHRLIIDEAFESFQSLFIKNPLHPSEDIFPKKEMRPLYIQISLIFERLSLGVKLKVFIIVKLLFATKISNFWK